MNEEKDRMTSRFGCVWQHILGYRHVDRDSKTSEGVLWNHLCHSFVCWETCFYNLIGGMGFLLSQLFLSTPNPFHQLDTMACDGNFFLHQRGAPRISKT